MDRAISKAVVTDAAIRAQHPLNDPWLEGLTPELYGRQAEPYYRFLYHLVLAMQPAVALEIGVEFGIGSAHMCAAAAEYGGHVIGVDINSHEMTKTILPQKFDNYHFIQGNSTSPAVYAEVLDLLAKHGCLGVVYQDSSHHYEASHREWKWYNQNLARGDVWVCDDITPAFHDPNIDPPGKGMVQYFDEIDGWYKFKFDGLHLGNVIGVVVL